MSPALIFQQDPNKNTYQARCGCGWESDEGEAREAFHAAVEHRESCEVGK